VDSVPAELREEEVESRWEAAPAVAVVMGLQVTLALVSKAKGWTLLNFPWWTWLVPVVPEAILFVTLAWSAPHRRLVQTGRRRTVGIALFALISLANAVALGALIVALMQGKVNNGAELLLEGVTIWGTNVIVFGLWFWGLDRGGPVRRRQPDPPPADFQFPQMENPKLAEPGWHTRLIDYIYVSFTNAIAFSPTDAMPLTRRAKLLMLTESAISAITVLLVAARAVNILK
jgi:hypothetical protein